MRTIFATNPFAGVRMILGHVWQAKGTVLRWRKAIIRKVQVFCGDKKESIFKRLPQQTFVGNHQSKLDRCSSLEAKFSGC